MPIIHDKMIAVFTITGLGFIVALVFLAKWQHSRRLAKQFASAGLPIDDVHFQTSAASLPHDHSFGARYVHTRTLY